MPESVRIALIGAGAFGVSLLEMLRTIRGVEIVAVADRDRERAQQVAARFDVQRAMSDMLQAIGCDDVNTVVIATPETLHVEPALAALDAGKNVFIEKPLAHDAPSAQKIVDAWKKSGRIVMPGHILRFEARVQAVRARLRQSGAVRSISCRQYRPRVQFEKYKRIHPAYVILIHHIDLCLAFAQSNVVKVGARERYFINKDSPSNLWAWLEFENGAIATLQMGYDLESASPAAPDDAIDIATERERIRLSFGDEGINISDKTGSSSVDLCYTQARRSELEYFVGCVQAGRQPEIVTPPDAAAAVEIAGRIVAAAKADIHA
jgi:predicted dehydrogenase